MKGDQHRAGNVGVGELLGLEARKEQSGGSDSTDLVCRDDQKQRRAQQGAAPQVPGVNVQRAFNPRLHPPAFLETTFLLSCSRGGADASGRIGARRSSGGSRSCVLRSRNRGAYKHGLLVHILGGESRTSADFQS